EPAPLGPDARGVGRLRNPPPGPHLSPAGRVLPPRPHEARRLPDGGSEGVLRYRRFREQVSRPLPERHGGRRGGHQRGQRGNGHGARARRLRGRPVFAGARLHPGGDAGGAHPQPRPRLGRPLRGARLFRLCRIRLRLREQGRGHRGDLAPPARPDLRLPLRPAPPEKRTRVRPRLPRRERLLPALRPARRGARRRPARGLCGRALRRLRPVLRALPLRGARLLAPLRPVDSRPRRRRTPGPRPRPQEAPRGLRRALRVLLALHDGDAPGADGRGGPRRSSPLPHRVLPTQPDRGQAEVPRRQRDRRRRLRGGRAPRAHGRDAPGGRRRRGPL
ncbi:MAG: Galactose-1-phosphate uridylyltransferase, partial [uncultured Rubrobacteraceae bacterium]